MSKTLEIWHGDYRTDEDKDYLVVSPDEMHDGGYEVACDSFETDLPLTAEDGCITINISNNKYFTVRMEQTTNGNKHVYINKDDAPVKKEYEFPYTAKYTFNEKVECVGIPDTDAARDQFKYMPHVNLVMEWGPSMSRKLVAVKVNGERYELN